MINRLNDIYPETLREHYENPRNYRVLEGDPIKASAVNPVCGDEVTIYLRGNNEIVREVTFH
jgi:nitrogen fixation NifU-like protein